MRKYRKDPISAIKDSITNQKYVFEGPTYELENLLCIKNMYTELAQNNIPAKLFLDDLVIEEKILDNCIKSSYIIAEQVREMINEEADE